MFIFNTVVIAPLLTSSLYGCLQRIFNKQTNYFMTGPQNQHFLDYVAEIFVQIH